MESASLNSLYESTRDWLECVLDAYRPELRAVAFPFFVHCYLELVESGKLKQGLKSVKNEVPKDQPSAPVGLEAASEQNPFGQWLHVTTNSLVSIPEGSAAAASAAAAVALITISTCRSIGMRRSSASVKTGSSASGIEGGGVAAAAAAAATALVPSLSCREVALVATC